MEEWIEVGAADEIAPGAYKIVLADDVPIAVFNIGGEFYAIEDVCTHDGGMLTGGEIEGC